ncbi:MAG: helix-turn-helix transcriptional regulator [Raoultibacter sp.]
MGNWGEKSAAPRRLAGLPLTTGLILIAGFGLFRGVNSSSYLSAIGSVDAAFLFVPNIAFNVSVAIVVITLSLVVVVAAQMGRLPAFSMPYRIPIALLCFVHLLGMTGIPSALPPLLVLAISAFCFGSCSVALSLIWIEFFVMEKPSMIIGQIACGMLLSVVCSWALGQLPLVVQSVLSCTILGFVGWAIFYLRGHLAAVLAKEGVCQPAPANAPAAVDATLVPTDQPTLAASRHGFWEALDELSDSLIAFFVLEAVIGLVNSYMLAGERIFVGAGSVSSIAMALAIVLFWVLVVMTQRMPKVSTVFRIAAPPIAAMLVLVPFLSDAYSMFFTVALLASYDFIAVLVTYQVPAVCHARRVASYAVMAMALGGARICLLVALLAGTAVGSAQGGYFGDNEQSLRFLVIVVAVIYALTIALVFFSRDRKRRRRAQEGNGDVAPQARPGEQLLEEACTQLSLQHGLTEREAEVLVYLARGRSCSHVANELVVSTNTIRGHVRNIYAKIGVHKRQELIDLVEASLR